MARVLICLGSLLTDLKIVSEAKARLLPTVRVSFCLRFLVLDTQQLMDHRLRDLCSILVLLVTSLHACLLAKGGCLVLLPDKWRSTQFNILVPARIHDCALNFWLVLRCEARFVSLASRTDILLRLLTALFLHRR